MAEGQAGVKTRGSGLLQLNADVAAATGETTRKERGKRKKEKEKGKRGQLDSPGLRRRCHQWWSIPCAARRISPNQEGEKPSSKRGITQS